MSESVVLDENLDESYEPTQEEIMEYAQYIGIELPEEEYLLYLAEEGLKAPLPDPWKPCKAEDGEIYYFNFATEESTWEHPCDQVYREKVIKARSKFKPGKSPVKDTADLFSLSDALQQFQQMSPLGTLTEQLSQTDPEQSSSEFENISEKIQEVKQQIERDRDNKSAFSSPFALSSSENSIDDLTFEQRQIEQEEIRKLEMYRQQEIARVEQQAKKEIEKLRDELNQKVYVDKQRIQEQFSGMFIDDGMLKQKQELERAIIEELEEQEILQAKLIRKEDDLDNQYKSEQSRLQKWLTDELAKVREEYNKSLQNREERKVESRSSETCKSLELQYAQNFQTKMKLMNKKYASKIDHLTDMLEMEIMNSLKPRRESLQQIYQDRYSQLKEFTELRKNELKQLNQTQITNQFELDKRNAELDYREKLSKLQSDPVSKAQFKTLEQSLTQLRIEIGKLDVDIQVTRSTVKHMLTAGRFTDY